MGIGKKAHDSYIYWSLLSVYENSNQDDVNVKLVINLYCLIIRLYYQFVDFVANNIWMPCADFSYIYVCMSAVLIGIIVTNDMVFLTGRYPYNWFRNRDWKFPLSALNLFLCISRIYNFYLHHLRMLNCDGYFFTQHNSWLTPLYCSVLSGILQGKNASGPLPAVTTVELMELL